MALQAVLWPVVSWIFREVVLKFVVFGVLFALLTLLMPLVIAQITQFVDVQNINSAIANVPTGVLFFARLFRFDVGIPLVISAFVSRFLIRRIPVVG